MSASGIRARLVSQTPPVSLKQLEIEARGRLIEGQARELELLRATNTELRLFKITVTHALQKHMPGFAVDPTPTEAEALIGLLEKGSAS